MHWEKRGLVFVPPADSTWMQSHAQIPTAVHLDGKIRIYFSTRPEPGLSMTTFLDVADDNPGNVLYVHDQPILELGPAGSFDAHGIMPQAAVRRESEVWLYYGGWDRRVSIPYSNWTGLAVSTDGGTTFEKHALGPIVDRTPDEIYSATGCCVVRGPDGLWHLFYACGIDWIEVDGKLEEYYLIRSAWSHDGIDWNRRGNNLLTPKATREPTHRPTVLRIDDAYHMWFCYRGIEDFRDGRNSYRMGYAKSTDLVTWFRDDTQAGIEPSNDGWDSLMTAYPNIVDTGNDVFLFYNGNGFGQSGFGYAKLNKP